MYPLKNKKIVMLLAIGLLNIFLCAYSTKKKTDTSEEKIVSINGTTTEVLCALGLEKKIIGVDITSTYPESILKLPKVGHKRNLSAEGIVSLNPTMVIGLDKDLKPELKQQLETAGIKVVLFKEEYSIQAAKNTINGIASYFGKTTEAQVIIKKINADLLKAPKLKTPKKVLFIYARGTGTMMVAGGKTSVEKMIELAGGKNAVIGFDDYKPFTAEALVAANPDVILLFDSGLESLAGIDGLLKIQGVAQTNAGKNKKVIEMDGLYLTSFGPRVGDAVATLATKLNY